MPDKERYIDKAILYILLAFVILYFYKLGFPSIWNPNEAFYAEAPREMVENGDLLTPYFNFEFRFEKPPLMYWLILPWQFLFGYKEVAVRLVSAIAACGGVLATYWFGKTVWNNKRAGMISALFLASAFDYNTAARYGSPEMLLTFLITTSLIVFYRWYIDDSKYKIYWLLLFYTTCGLSTLTKGPVGIILPSMIITFFYLIKKDFRGLLKVISFRGIMLYLLIAVPWYLIMIQKHGSAFYDVVLGENVSRYLSKKSGTSNYFFYFGVLSWNFFPGSVFIIPAFIQLRSIARRDHAVFYPLIWFIVVFVFFSISKSKLPTYIYPLFAPLAVIVGGWANSALDRDPRQGNILLWLAPLIPLTVLAGTLWIKSYLPEISPLLIGLLIFLLSWIVWNIKEKNFPVSFAVALSAMAIFIFIFLQNIIPQIENNYRPYRAMAVQVKNADPGKEHILYCYKGCQQNMTYYFERKVKKIRKEPEFNKALAVDSDAFFLLKHKTYVDKYANTGKRIIWKGMFHRKSESRFMRFLSAIKNKKIEEYVIIK
ncbi:MAG: glycosyltransferase family 39 protein [Thermodesulfovibrionales bacterium]